MRNRYFSENAGVNRCEADGEPPPELSRLVELAARCEQRVVVVVGTAMCI